MDPPLPPSRCVSRREREARRRCGVCAVVRGAAWRRCGMGAAVRSAADIAWKRGIGLFSVLQVSS